MTWNPFRERRSRRNAARLDELAATRSARPFKLPLADNKSLCRVARTENEIKELIKLGFISADGLWERREILNYRFSAPRKPKGGEWEAKYFGIPCKTTARPYNKGEKLCTTCSTANDEYFSVSRGILVIVVEVVELRVIKSRQTEKASKFSHKLVVERDGWVI